MESQEHQAAILEGMLCWTAPVLSLMSGNSHISSSEVLVISIHLQSYRALFSMSWLLRQGFLSLNSISLLIMTWFLFFSHWFSHLYLSKSLPCLKAVDKGGVKSVGSSLSGAGWGVPKLADAPSTGAVAQGMAHLSAHRWWRQGASATPLVPQHSGQDARLGTGPGRPHLTWVHS